MGIGKIGSKLVNLFSRTSGKGKFLGKSKNGIEVFRKTSKNGTTVTSSYKEGKLYKSITKSEFKKDNTVHYNPNIEVGHTIVAKNYETGITTHVNKANVNYKKGFSQYDTFFNPGVRNEFSIYRLDENNSIIGASHRYINSPGFFTSKRIARYKNGLPYYDATKNVNLSSGYTDRIINTFNYQFSNGSKLTGEFARRTYTDPITNTVKNRGLYYYGGREIAVTQNANGENIVKTGYGVIN